MNHLSNYTRHLVAGLFLVLFVPGCSASPMTHALRYTVYAANFGTNGVMLIAPSLIDINGNPTNKWRGINPTYPIITHQRFFYSFTDYKNNLPENNIEVIWKLAKLENCSKSQRSKDFPDHVLKSSCDWEPISKTMFQKKIDLTKIRNSAAYKRTGKPVNGNYLYGEYTLNIELIFNEDQLTVKTTNGQTKGLGQ